MIENYDAIYKDPDDVYDANTKIKLHGYHDYEKVDEWKNVMYRTLKRRLLRKQEKEQDDVYFCGERSQSQDWHGQRNFAAD